MEGVAGTDPTGTEPTGTDLIGRAIGDLYSGDLDAFIERRRELAAQARAAGDRAAAKTIAGLGKPTRSAWAVNRLVHADPGVPASLAELGDKLRAGEAALDGASIRELSRARRELIEALTRRALAESGQGSASAAMREEVTDTFSAALADPEVAEQVAAGRLVRAAHWAGFGPGIGTAIGTTPPRAPTAGGSTAGRAATTGRARTTTAADAQAVAAEEASQQREALEPGAAGREERVERERQRRAAVADAEQAVTDASRLAEAAAAAEREAADSVLFMQERLNREQQRLAQAKRDVSQATAALNRARQALQRIRRESW
jgi:hypothetical protein